MSKKRKLWIAAGVLALALVAGGAAAVAGGDGGDSRPITGDSLEKASAAALEATGGGRVTGTETGDEDGAYEVEVTMSSGEQIDVHLDSDFKVIGQKADREDPNDTD